MTNAVTINIHGLNDHLEPIHTLLHPVAPFYDFTKKVNQQESWYCLMDINKPDFDMHFYPGSDERIQNWQPSNTCVKLVCSPLMALWALEELCMDLNFIQLLRMIRNDYQTDLDNFNIDECSYYIEKQLTRLTRVELITVNWLSKRITLRDFVDNGCSVFSYSSKFFKIDDRYAILIGSLEKSIRTCLQKLIEKERQTLQCSSELIENAERLLLMEM